jgi:hypothetical protein
MKKTLPGSAAPKQIFGVFYWTTDLANRQAQKTITPAFDTA